MQFGTKMINALFPCYAQVKRVTREGTEQCQKACEDLKRAGHELADSIHKRKEKTRA